MGLNGPISKVDFPEFLFKEKLVFRLELSQQVAWSNSLVHSFDPNEFIFFVVFSFCERSKFSFGLRSCNNDHCNTSESQYNSGRVHR